MSTFVEPVLSACIVLHHSGMRVLHAVQCFQESDIELELHVVDNAPDNTLGAHLQWQCPGVQYYPQRKDLGFGGGNNLILPNLRSQYHLICHPDVTFDERLLSHMISYMEHNPECVILSPRFMNAKGKEQPMPRRAPTTRYLLGSALRRLGGPFRLWYEEYTLADSDLRTPTSVEVAPGACMLIRTETLRKLDGFNPQYFLAHGDSDLSRRARQMGVIVYHPDMVVTHDKQTKSRSLPEMVTRMSDALRYLRKH
nr:glycosyltransferase [Clostridia bacterium]